MVPPTMKNNTSTSGNVGIQGVAAVLSVVAIILGGMAISSGNASKNAVKELQLKLDGEAASVAQVENDVRQLKAQTQNAAIQMAMIVMLPSIFFTGFIFPRETMPWIFQAIGALLPLTYFVELTRAIVLRGATATEFGRHLVVLAIMGVALFSLCALRFKKKLA